MIRFQLTPLDLTRTRFAFSPLWEVVRSYHVFQNADKAAIHLPWLREAKPFLETLDLSPLAVLVKIKHSYVPDFLAPPPSTTFPSFEEEIETLLSRARVRLSARKFAEFGTTRYPEVAQPYLDNPRKALGTLAELLRVYWQETLEHHWPDCV